MHTKINANALTFAFRMQEIAFYPSLVMRRKTSSTSYRGSVALDVIRASDIDPLLKTLLAITHLFRKECAGFLGDPEEDK